MLSKEHKYLHIAEPDKFTLPLCDFIINNDELENHSFLFISNRINGMLLNNSRVNCYTFPFRKNIIFNLKLFYKLCRDNEIIYLHGSPFTFLFRIFPQFTKKIAWVINGAELYNNLDKTQNKIVDNNRFTLKRVSKHISHIEGDSQLANKLFNSKAKFHYSPMYLSNVVKIDNFNPTILKENVKILVGNSNSENNDHLTIFKQLKKFEKEIEYILCPLSYGKNISYKQSVIENGIKIFGDKFKFMENFMPIRDYNKILSKIDIAVFNHWRQEAMGVTLTLLSLGKIVYSNPNTTSFESLTKRGFKIYNNNLIFNDGPLIKRDIYDNKTLLEKYYSEKMLIESLKNITK